MGGHTSASYWFLMEIRRGAREYILQGADGTWDKGLHDVASFSYCSFGGKGASSRYGFLLQADIEIAQAQDAAEASGQAEVRRAQAGSDEDDDVAVFKARSMDEWKDDHPSGYGNSKLRPTA